MFPEVLAPQERPCRLAPCNALFVNLRGVAKTHPFSARTTELQPTKLHGMIEVDRPSRMAQLTLPHFKTSASPERTIRRPIHYLGSKLRLVDEILAWIDELAPLNDLDRPAPACDLFAGSGAVTGALAAHRPVVSVDVQEYSRVLCSALLRPASVASDFAERLSDGLESCPLHARLSDAITPLIQHEDWCIAEASDGNPEPLCHLLERGSIVAANRDGIAAMPTSLASAMKTTCSKLIQTGLMHSADSVVSRYYGGLYFGYKQSLALDVILASIAKEPASHRDTLKAATLSTASEIVNTVGKQFAQPIRPRGKDGRPKPGLWTRVKRDRSLDVLRIFIEWSRRFATAPSARTTSEALCKDYLEFLTDWKDPISIFYADPPYTRDHYSRFYHVLETLCLRDSPDISTSNIGAGQRLSRGMYRAQRHQSPFCIQSKAPKAFAELFAHTRWFDAPLIVSYSPFDAASRARPRLMSIDQLVNLARSYYSDVSVESAGRVAHSKLNRKNLNVTTTDNAELFIICRP